MHFVVTSENFESFLCYSWKSKWKKNRFGWFLSYPFCFFFFQFMTSQKNLSDLMWCEEIQKDSSIPVVFSFLSIRFWFIFLFRNRAKLTDITFFDWSNLICQIEQKIIGIFFQVFKFDFVPTEWLTLNPVLDLTQFPTVWKIQDAVFLVENPNLFYSISPIIHIQLNP